MKARVFIGVLACAIFAGVAQGTVILQDDFDSYADQAAFAAAWPAAPSRTPAQMYGSDVLPDHTSGTGNWVISSSASYTEQSIRYFDTKNVLGTEAQPLKFEYWCQLVNPVDATYRAMDEIRGYINDVMTTVPEMDGLVAMGAWNTGNKWQARTLGVAGAGPSYQETTIVRSAGWHKLTALIKGTTVEYYVDDVLGLTTSVTSFGNGFDLALLNSGYSTTGGNFAMSDDLLIEVVPEPATLALLGLGGLFLRRRR